MFAIHSGERRLPVEVLLDNEAIDGTWHIEPATGEEYAFNRDNRTDIPYKIDHEDLAYKLFTAAGFEWGGDWISLKDYQHFEIDINACEE